jgi:glycosyltransferase involved in cell wall biosynthesis
MRIGVDARPLSVGRGGTYRVIWHLLRHLSELDRSNDYFLYSKLAFGFPLDNPRWTTRLHKRMPLRPTTMFFQTGAGQTVSLDAIDAFWAPTGLFPRGLPASMPKILSVYDMVWYFYPETMDERQYWMFRLFVKPSIRSADKIITISESTASDLNGILKIPRSKICIAYPGVDESFQPIQRDHAANEIARKYGTSTDYICTVGTVEPRKNVITLIDAMGILNRARPFPYQLLVAGASGWKNSKIYERVERAGLTHGEIKFLGHVADEHLPLLYSGARLFVFPSLYEGFGIPLIEAMACGTPIVASNAKPVPEVVQDAALLVDPHSAREFADAILRLTDSEDLRQSLAEKGLRRASTFGWRSAAERVLQVLQGVNVRRNGQSGP